MTIWADIQTKNGFASDEVQSSLQKYIRRAKVEEACQPTNYIHQALFS